MRNLEQKEKQHRIEDALAATRAAIEEGIVAGGGVTLLRVRNMIKDLKFEGDEEVGADIVRKALEEPMKIIAENAGKEGSVIVHNVLNKEGAFGYNAAIDKYEDLIKAGIIDPKKVTRSALQNAGSAASMLLTTEVVVAELPEDKKDTGMGGGMPGMGGMGGMM